MEGPRLRGTVKAQSCLTVHATMQPPSHLSCHATLLDAQPLHRSVHQAPCSRWRCMMSACRCRPATRAARSRAGRRGRRRRRTRATTSWRRPPRGRPRASRAASARGSRPAPGRATTGCERRPGCLPVPPSERAGVLSSAPVAARRVCAGGALDAGGQLARLPRRPLAQCPAEGCYFHHMGSSIGSEVLLKLPRQVQVRQTSLLACSEASWPGPR